MDESLFSVKKRTATLLLSCSVIGCEEEKVFVNVENKEDLNSNHFGELIKISDYLYYDSMTRIVYWWNGYVNYSYSSISPSPYYAPNGLPYRYNVETNTFEMIESDEVE